MIEATRVKQTSTTTGTGNLTLAAAPTGFRRFLDVMTAGSLAGISGEDWAPYMAETADGSEWEFGVARIFDDAGQGELARSTAVIFESSNADALVSFTADTTVRLITPPNIDKYKRGVKVFLSASQAILQNGDWVSWDTEQTDTDACWSIGDPTRIYIPAWAEEVEIWCYVESSNTDKTDLPVMCKVEGIATERDPYTTGNYEALFPVTWLASSSDAMYGANSINVRVDRSVIDINDTAIIRIELSDPSASTLNALSNTKAWMRVIR